MGDIVGRLFREFAVTLAVTILVSAAVSLSLTPMMCAKLLKRHDPKHQSRFYKSTENFYNRVIEFYGRSLKFVLQHQTITLLVTAGTLVLTLFLYVVVPKGFFPVQDTGVILGISEGPQNTSFPALAKSQQALAHEPGAHSLHHARRLSLSRSIPSDGCTQAPHRPEPDGTALSPAQRRRLTAPSLQGVGILSAANRFACESVCGVEGPLV